MDAGVDRIDYTKGILERFRAVERLFEVEPQWLGRFTFVQICAPTRSRVEQYQAFEAKVRALATGAFPVFIGDDLTDEQGFRVVNELRGISVKVGDAATAARLRLPDVAAVHDFLAQVAAAY